MSQPNSTQEDSKLTITDDIVVSLDYTLSLDDGEVVDSSDDQEPLEFIQGAGHIIPGLEQALYGMAIGEQKKVTVQPDDAYGDINPDAYQLVPRDLFPDDMELVEGMGLRMIDENSGEPVDAFVSEVQEEEVLLDFNHPLAGETLHFEISIADLRPATQEEIDHGHVHEENGHR